MIFIEERREYFLLNLIVGKLALMAFFLFLLYQYLVALGHLDYAVEWWTIALIGGIGIFCGLYFTIQMVVIAKIENNEIFLLKLFRWEKLEKENVQRIENWAWGRWGIMIKTYHGNIFNAYFAYIGSRWSSVYWTARMKEILGK